MRRLQKQWMQYSLIVITVLAVYTILRSGPDSEAGTARKIVFGWCHSGTVYRSGNLRGNIKDTKTQSILRSDPTAKEKDQGDKTTFVEERNKMRIAQVKQTCNTLKNATGRRTMRVLMNPNHDITWCRVNKVASTYTLGMFQTIFNCSLDRILATAREVHDLSNTDMRQMIETSYKFTFVREPFGRLFSTYSNKFYFPKSHWAPIGPKVVKRYRNRPSKDSLIYGHDITFYEMIKYIVEEYEAGRNLDEHLRPMHERCNPCDYQYAFIGKLETMVSDWTYLINEWSRTRQINVPNKAGEKELHFNETNHMLDTFIIIKDSTISRYKLYLRAWSYYKIVGHIYKHFDMPFGENSEIEINDFRNALEEAAKKSKPHAEETKIQKAEALKQAYASVPSDLLERLRKVVAIDCMMYGYDNKPDWVFDRKDVQAEYNYFQGLE